MKKLNLLALFVLVAVSLATAQPKQTLVTVAVSPDHSDWLYTCGEKPKFSVSVTTSHCPVADAKIHYEISEDMLAPIKKGDMVLKDGTTVISGYTMKKAGFLRCRVWATVDGRKYEECATAGFDIDRIEPKTVMPDDFVEFWEKALAANRKIDMLPELTLVPEKCTSKVNVYSASFQSFRKGSRIYGTLCVPAKIEGKCPAILIVPGAGCRSRKGFYDEAEKGFVTFEVGIHGIPTVLPDESLYTDLKNGSLIDYWFAGIDDKDNYFYKRVFLGCARAIDFLAELDFVDENHIGVTGGSQGGALTLTTAYLNPKVKCAAASTPARCDLTGYLHDQGNAWPYMFRNKKLGDARTPRNGEILRRRELRAPHQRTGILLVRLQRHGRLPDLRRRRIQLHHVAQKPHGRAAVAPLHLSGTVESALEMDDGECREINPVGR